MEGGILEKYNRMLLHAGKQNCMIGYSLILLPMINLGGGGGGGG